MPTECIACLGCQTPMELLTAAEVRHDVCASCRRRSVAGQVWPVWTAEDERRLLDMAAEGMRTVDIAAVLDRTPNAIYQRRAMIARRARKRRPTLIAAK